MEPSTGRARWLDAGQQLLRMGGSPAVKLSALTATTGLTTGSFYHHFSGMQDYLDVLATFYGEEQVNELLRAIVPAAPEQRLAGLARLADDERMGALDAAMRDWAGSNPLAAAAVEAADATLLRFIERALLDLGHPRPEARTRAVMLLAIGTARIHSPWKLPASAAGRMLEIVSRPAGEPR